MSIRPEQPEPFLRGCVFPAVTEAPYPRADPANAEYLPADVWDAAHLPVGVRLEMAGNARTVRVWYKTTTASLGYRGESAGCCFVAYRAGQKVAVAEAVMGEGMVELVITGRTDSPLTIYLPEGMRPLVTGVAGVEEPMDPAPLQPRWLAYGDAVTQGWLASAPPMAWPAVAGRKLGLDVCNLGYAGTARGETTSALMLAETPAEVISIAFGLNNWNRVPHTVGLMSEEVRCFLSVVREGHPEIPIVVVSPTARPDAEETPNRVGATLAELRRAMEETVRQCVADGDEKLFLVEGLATVDPEDLEDGMYPGDEGHRRLAAAVAKVLVPHLAEIQEVAEKRWADEGTPITPIASRAATPPPPGSMPSAPAKRSDTVDAVDVADTVVADTVEPPDDVLDLIETDLLDVGLPDAAPGTDPSPVAAEAEAAERDDVVGDGTDDGDGVEPVDVEMFDAEDDEEPALDAGADRPESVTTVTDEETAAGSGDSHDAPVARAVKKPVRRDTTPADIEIADMVVAALTLATNGADDVFVNRDEPSAEYVPTYELEWEDANPTEALSWVGDPTETEKWQWSEAAVVDDGPWETGEAPEAGAWVAADGTDELEWVAADGTPDEFPWVDADGSGTLDGGPWVDEEGVGELEWTDAVAVGSVEELQWTGAAEPGS